MNLTGRRESSNVDDRRGKKVGAGLGIVAEFVIGNETKTEIINQATENVLSQVSNKL